MRAMCSDALGVQLVFIPEEYGGMGGSAFDSYRVCERMARFDIGLGDLGLRDLPGQRPDPDGRHRRAAAALAGSHRRGRDHLRLRRDRARGRQRPRRDDHGRRRRSDDDGTVTGYRITGRKQWISNGSIADCLLASSPWPRTGRPGSSSSEGHRRASPPAPPEDKHGIRLSNTAALFLDDVDGAGRAPGRRRRGPRAGPGPAGLRLHPADGRGVRPRRRLGGPGPRDPLLARSASRAAPRSARSRATPTS